MRPAIALLVLVPLILAACGKDTPPPAPEPAPAAPPPSANSAPAPDPKPSPEARRPVRPGLDASKVPAVPDPRSGGGRQYPNIAAIPAALRCYEIGINDSLDPLSVFAFPFYRDGKGVVDSYSDLSEWVRTMRVNMDKSDATFVFADARCVPRGATLAECESWLGARMVKSGEELYQHARTHDADLVAIFMVSRAKKGGDTIIKGATALIAVKHADSTRDARVIGYVD